jgi:hypothetical protein
MKPAFFLLASVACLGQAAYTGIHGVTTISNPSIGPLNLSSLAAHPAAHICYSASTSSFPSDIEAGSTTRIDNLGNTYTCTTRNEDGDVRIASCSSIGLSTSSSMTFTAPNGFWQSMTVAVYTGVTSGPDQTATTVSTGTTGQVTPTNADELVVSCIGDAGTGLLTVNNTGVSPPMIQIDSYQRVVASAEGVADSYQIQTTSTPATVNPNWSNFSGETAGVTQTFFSTASPETLSTISTTLPEGFVGVAYSKQLQAQGGVQPYTWTVASGTLPNGLSLSTGGLISGTPTSAISATPLSFLVTDSNSSTASLPNTGTLPLTIAAAQLSITTSTCSGGVQYAAYAGCTIVGTGGTGALTYSWTTGGGNGDAPPEGLGLNASTGAITSGLIGAQGIYTPTITVTDSLGATASKSTISFSFQAVNAWMFNVFPHTGIAYHRMDLASTGLPVSSSPADQVNSIEMNEPISPYFGTQGGNGIPAIQVPYNQAYVNVTTTLYQSYFSSAPFPNYLPTEDSAIGCDYAGGGNDCHGIVYLEAGGGNPPALFEAWNAQNNGNGTWNAFSNALWPNTTTNTMTPQADNPSCNSTYSMGVSIFPCGTTDASGLSLLMFLVTASEVNGTGTPTSPNGAVLHVMRYTPQNHMLANWGWPGTDTAGVGSCTGVAQDTLLSQSSPPSACTNSPAAGAIWRLKASVYTSLPSCFSTSPQSSIIATGLYQYGMIMADNGAHGLIGTPDSQWNNSDLTCLANLIQSDFEPVNVSSIMISGPTSFAASSGGGGGGTNPGSSMGGSIQVQVQ